MEAEDVLGFAQHSGLQRSPWSVPAGIMEDPGGTAIPRPGSRLDSRPRRLPDPLRAGISHGRPTDISPLFSRRSRSSPTINASTPTMARFMASRRSRDARQRRIRVLFPRRLRSNLPHAAIYADAIQNANVDGVELLQFGIYREIGLKDWYRLLNVGFPFSVSVTATIPACRWLADCRTYASTCAAEHNQYRAEHESVVLKRRRPESSFVTTGPLLLLDVDGQVARRADRSDRSAAACRHGRRSACDREVTPVTGRRSRRQRKRCRENPGSRTTERLASGSEVERPPRACAMRRGSRPRAFSTARPPKSRRGSPHQPGLRDAWTLPRLPYDRGSLDALRDPARHADRPRRKNAILKRQGQCRGVFRDGRATSLLKIREVERTM